MAMAVERAEQAVARRYGVDNRASSRCVIVDNRFLACHALVDTLTSSVTRRMSCTTATSAPNRVIAAGAVDIRARSPAGKLADRAWSRSQRSGYSAGTQLMRLGMSALLLLVSNGAYKTKLQAVG